MSGSCSWSFICVHGCQTCARSRSDVGGVAAAHAGNCVMIGARCLARASSGSCMRDVRSCRGPAAGRCGHGPAAGVRQVLSPHFDARPPRTAARAASWCTASACRRVSSAARGSISCSPAPCRGTAHPYFASIEGLRVSAHVLIRRDGALMQYVPFGERAWHAGVSQYGTRSACNDFSIGIELEGADEMPYTEAQYEALAALVRGAARRLPVAVARAPRRPQRHRARAQDRSRVRRSTGRGCARSLRERLGAAALRRPARRCARCLPRRSLLGACAHTPTVIPDGYKGPTATLQRLDQRHPGRGVRRVLLPERVRRHGRRQRAAGRHARQRQRGRKAGRPQGVRAPGAGARGHLRHRRAHALRGADDGDARHRVPGRRPHALHPAGPNGVYVVTGELTPITVRCGSRMRRPARRCRASS